MRKRRVILHRNWKIRAWDSRTRYMVGGCVGGKLRAGELNWSQKSKQEMLKHPTLPLFVNSRPPLARSNVFTSYLAVHPRKQQFCIQLAYSEDQHLQKQSPLQTKSYQLPFHFCALTHAFLSVWWTLIHNSAQSLPLWKVASNLQSLFTRYN